jgi:purine-binding chemotaxis protein CheW
MSTATNLVNIDTTELLTTFYLGTDLFGIEVMKVQEVTGSPMVVPVPLAPSFVSGLINLRGQLATALGLRELFGFASQNESEKMSVVCRVDGNLVSLLVDAIGDVTEVNKQNYEMPPDTIPTMIRRFVKGVYKMDGHLISVIDLDKLAKALSPSNEVKENNNN